MARATKSATRTQKKPTADRVERAKEVRKRLSRAMPKPQCELAFESPWQLLIATILSAQSTDKMVNRVTPALFSRWPSPEALAGADGDDVEIAIKSTGFFRVKGKAIREASRLIVERFGGEVPRTVEELSTLPGVARKTANVVLGTSYGLASGIPVDTHASRVSFRLGLTTHKDPVRIEHDLCGLFAKRDWIDMGHRLVLHGRYVCLARSPKCGSCPLNEVCPSRVSEPEGSLGARARWEGDVVEARGVPQLQVDPDLQRPDRPTTARLVTTEPGASRLKRGERKRSTGRG